MMNKYSDMIREELIQQVKDAYKTMKANGKLNDENNFFAATPDGQPLTYRYKFIEAFETDLILICRNGGGESTCYSLEYMEMDEDEIKYAFDQFDKLFDMEYIWISYKEYEIGQDEQSIYVGNFDPCTGLLEECDEDEYDAYEECKVIKRFETVEEAKAFIDTL